MNEGIGPPAPAVAALRGALAETIAALWLRMRGLEVLDRNLRADGGEVDLLARDGECLVFVEVRLRRGGAWVGAAASIDRDKRRRLRRCARALLRGREDLRWPGRTVRFDVVELESRQASLGVRHLVSVRL